MNSIYFCFPYRGVGGIPFLFVRLAEFIASTERARCYLIDYHDGYMARIHNPELVQLVEYPTTGKVIIPSGACAVFQAVTPWSIFPNIVIHKDVKVLFWTCHPLNLIPSLPGFRWLTSSYSFSTRLMLKTILKPFTRKVKRFLLFLISKDAIVFMDGVNYQTTQSLLNISEFEPKFLPIPITVPGASNQNEPARVTRCIKFVWIGRIVDFKYHSLHRCLQDLSKVARSSDYHFKVMIVGEGDLLDRLRKDISQPVFSSIEFSFKKNVGADELDAFLLKNASIAIAMGTSALESAKLGIPTLVLDFSYKKISGSFEYRWLHEVVNFNLGGFAGLNHNNKGSTIRDKIEEFIKHPQVVSEEERKYVHAKHDMSLVARDFLKCLRDSNCTYGDLADNKLVSRGFLYFVFYRARYICRKVFE